MAIERQKDLSLFSRRKIDRVAAHNRAGESMTDEIGMELGAKQGSQELTYAFYDSPLDAEYTTSAFNLRPEFALFATDMDDRKVGYVKLKPYIEDKLQHKNGSAIGIEYGGPGSALFSEFDVFERTLGVALEDLRDEETKARDAERNHTLITGDMQSPEVKAKVEEWLNGEKADFILEGMVGGLTSIPADPYHISDEFNGWYRQLAPGGLMLVEAHKVMQPLLEPWENLANQHQGLQVRVALHGSRSGVELIKGPDAPENLPLLSPREVRKAYDIDAEDRRREHVRRILNKDRRDIEWLDDIDLGEQIACEDDFLVYEIQGRKDVVMKRMMSIPEILPQGVDASEYFDSLIENHNTVKHYFGEEFIPDTVFTTVNYPLYGGDTYEVAPDKEYIAIQDSTDGLPLPSIDFTAHAFEAQMPEVTDAMHEQVDTFIDRYTLMQQETGTVPNTAGQVYFNFKDNKVILTDTTSSIKFDNFLGENSFLHKIGVDPQQILDAPNPQQELLDIVAPYANISRVEVDDFDGKVDPDSPRFAAMYNKLMDEGFTSGEMLGLNNLATGIAYFPPEGENIVLRQFRALGLVKSEQQEIESQEPDFGVSSEQTISQQEEQTTPKTVYKSRTKSK